MKKEDEQERRKRRLNEELDKFEREHSPEEIEMFYSGMSRDDLFRIIDYIWNDRVSFNEANTGKVTRGL